MKAIAKVNGKEFKYHNIDDIEIEEIERDEILKYSDIYSLDSNNEYLVLYLNDGNTATFKYSETDIEILLNESIEEYLSNELEDYTNIEEIFSIVQEINSYDGSLDSLDYFINDDEFFNTFFKDPSYLAQIIHYSYNNGHYDYTDDYIKINYYGHLETANLFDLRNEIKDLIDEITERIIELNNHLYLPNDIIHMIDIYNQFNL